MAQVMNILGEASAATRWALAVCAGYVVKALVDHFAGNTNSLWKTVGTLERRIEALERQLAEERWEKHAWRNIANGLHLERLVYAREVNELLAADGRNPRYDLRDLRPPELPTPPTSGTAA